MTARRPALRRRHLVAAGTAVAGVALAALGVPLAAARDEPAPIADQDLLVRIAADAAEVDLGRAFSVTVVRSWRKDLAPAEWNDAALAPLFVRLAGTTRREDARHVEETRRYEAWAFSLGDVTTEPPSITARARDGMSPEQMVAGEPLAVSVRRALDSAAPGEPELPGGLLPEPFPWRALALLGAAGGAALILVGRARRARAQRDSVAASAASAQVASTSPAAPPAPHERALRRLDRLRANAPATAAETQTWYAEAAAVVRDYLGERFAACTPEMTTEEILAAPPTLRTLSAPHRALLAATLSHCDLVKFARHAPGPPERERLLASATEFVTQTTAAPSATTASGTDAG